MQIFITDLAAYNGGALIGEWVSLPMDEQELNTKIKMILDEGAAALNEGYHEEVFITDYECDFLDINEYDSIEELNRIADAAQSLNERELKAVRFLMDNHLVNGFEEALDKYEDVIIHEDMSMEDIAYEYVNECYNLEDMPSLIANNIDYEKIAREFEIDGSFFVVGTDVIEYLT